MTKLNSKSVQFYLTHSAELLLKNDNDDWTQENLRGKIFNTRWGSSVSGKTIVTTDKANLGGDIDGDDYPAQIIERVYKIIDDKVYANKLDVHSLSEFIDNTIPSNPLLTSIRINDGYQEMLYTLDYEAIFDTDTMNEVIFNANHSKDCNSTFINKVKVYQGTPESNIGYTEYFFYTGLDLEELPEVPESQYELNTHYKNSLKTLPYRVKEFSNSGDLVKMTENIYDFVVKEFRDKKKVFAVIKEKQEIINQVMQRTVYQYTTDPLLLRNSTLYYNIESEPTQRKEMYTYAFDIYDDPIFSNITKTVSSKVTIDNELIKHVAVPFKNIDGRWIQNSQYEWNGTGQGQFNFSSPESNFDFIKKSEIISLDSKGNVIETEDIDGIITSAKFDYNDNLLKMKAKNATPEEIFYTSFDLIDTNYEIWNNYNSYQNMHIDSRRGDKSLFITKIDDMSYVYATVGNFKEGKTYQASVWFKSDEDSYARILFCDYNDVNGEPYENSVTKTMTGNGEWQELKVNITQSKNEQMEVFLYCDGDIGQSVKFDDLTIYPIDATIETYTYDQKSYSISSSTDNNGVVTKYEYDLYNNNNFTCLDNSLFQRTMNYLSALTNTNELGNNIFNSNDPNANIVISSQKGYFNNFDKQYYSLGDWQQLTGNWSISNGNLKQTNSETISKVYTEYTQSESMVYEWKQKIDNEDGFLGFYFLADNLDDQNEFDKSYYINISNSEVNLYNISETSNYHLIGNFDFDGGASGNWMVIYKYHIISIFRNGKKIGEISADEIEGVQAINAGNYFAFVSGYTTASFDNVKAYKNPAISATYFNGLGKAIQIQSIKKNGIAVSDSIYDSFGRKAIVTKVGLYENEHLNYKANFSYFDFDNNEISGEILSRTNDGMFPFSQQIYEQTPQSRIIESSIPGEEYSIFQGNTPKHVHDLDPSEYDTSYSNDNFNATKTIDPQGIEVISIRDIFDREVKSIIDYGFKNIQTEYKYNKKGNLIEKRLPNYFDETVTNNTEFKINYDYDHFDNIIQVHSPDYGYKRRRYDIANRLILEQHQENIDNSKAKQITYDYLGRIKKIGQISLSGNETLEDVNYPRAFDYVAKEFLYDISGENSGLRGAVYKIITTNENNDITEERFFYNRKGEVIRKDLRNFDYDNTNWFSVEYDYDNGGNMIEVKYPSAQLPNFLDISFITDETYVALNSIAAGGEGAVVSNGQSVSFVAGQEITLKPGFWVEPGGNFSASIENIEEESEPIIVTYKYDEFGRLTNIGSEISPDTYASYEYDVDGRISYEYINDNSYQIGYAYNSPHFLTDIYSEHFTQNITYTSGGFNNAAYYNGNIASINYQQNGFQYHYKFSYDSIGQLLNAECSGFSDAEEYSYYDFIYDANGNTRNLTKNNENRTYNYQPGTNKVTGIEVMGNPHANYGYDAIGNIVVSDRSTKFLEFTYDSISLKVLELIDDEDSNMKFFYDSNDERIMKKALNNGNEMKKLYLHGLNPFPLATFSDSEFASFFIYGPQGIVAKIQNDDCNFVIKDHLGSSRLILNEENEVLSSYSYDAFGNLMPSEVSEEISYQYTGQEYDSELDLHNFRARFYDSDLMRFYAVDPMEEFASPYLYCGNNPILFVDPTGKYVEVNGADCETFREYMDDGGMVYGLDFSYDTGRLELMTELSKEEYDKLPPTVQLLVDAIRDTDIIVDLQNISPADYVKVNGNTSAVPVDGFFGAKNTVDDLGNLSDTIARQAINMYNIDRISLCTGDSPYSVLFHAITEAYNGGRHTRDTGYTGNLPQYAFYAISHRDAYVTNIEITHETRSNNLVTSVMVEANGLKIPIPLNVTKQKTLW
jgi:RHS repeat-associated protein